jgi:transcriptional regulator with XRE-family HTH domain
MAPFSNIRVKIGQRLGEARERRDLTQDALARRLGVHYRVVQRYERGEKLTIERIVIIARELHACGF